MSKVLTKSIIAILAVGILVGAATSATIIIAGLKPFNLALAQLRVPFLAQPRVQAPLQQPFLAQPGVQAPLQQQPLATTTSSGSGSFGPNCVGCITTQNLANGAVTNPKLGPLSVSSANIGAGQVGTGNIADGAVTTQKIAHSAVSVSTTRVEGQPVTITPGGFNVALANCPQGSIVSGGGYTFNLGVDTAAPPTVVWSQQGQIDIAPNAWNVSAIVPNTALHAAVLTPVATCETIHP